MVDTYYKTGKAFWTTDNLLKKITDRADKLRPILIGNIAPNMALLDTTLKYYIQLWSVVADYTIMVFWDPDCGHCKKELESLKAFYEENNNDYSVAVYSICTDTSLTRWKEKIKEKGIEDFINVNGTRSALGNYQELYDVFATPLIFVLDNEKKIIAKKIGADNVPVFVKQYAAIRKEEKD
jgi:thiol-disulfide isomerase/thioredoxin